MSEYFPSPDRIEVEFIKEPPDSSPTLGNITGEAWDGQFRLIQVDFTLPDVEVMPEQQELKLRLHQQGKGGEWPVILVQ